MSDNMVGLKRTNYCGELRKENEGQKVTVCGWVQKQRDLGNLIFVDLRDRTGIVQLAFGDTTDKYIFEKAFKIRAEYVIVAEGTVRTREAINTEIPTGDIEIEVTDLRVVSASQTTPFEIVENSNVKEELRLKYRYLDLRRPDMQSAMIYRHKIAKAARDYYDNNGFIELETPTLIKATPEGARDYLVPSRVHPGEFYALPQSPQLYKQLLMLSGFDRYMQIARCYRDEDLRADRQPEFTQIDLEMSFVDEQDVMDINEGFIKHVFKEVLDVEVETPFLRMPYQQAMDRYGSDKPDIRFGLELVNISDAVKSTEFKVFAGALSEGGSVRAINVKNSADKLSRKEVDKLVEVVKTYGAKGLAFTRWTSETISSSFEKFLSESEVEAVRTAMGAEPNDVILVVADPSEDVVFASLGALRCHLADKLGMIAPNVFKFLWVTDFPLFEYSPEEDRYYAKHHPFTSPKVDQLDMIETDKANVCARAYDMVLNGCEVGGGSIRINDPDIQQKMFIALGFTKEEAEERFGFLLDAFKYGVPPHGGMAFGLDRLVMLMLQKDSIRDVIAFPKVQNARELMTNCPTQVEEKNLVELGISVIEQKK